MAIPKIIHQTYKTNGIPEPLSDYRSKLLNLHPDWEYRFYDDRQCREVLERHCPYFLPLYDSYNLPVQKADIFRIIVVNTFGGFYMDMDVECLFPLNELCEFRSVFGEEITLTEEESARKGHLERLRVANFMFGSEPGHPFLLYILRELARESLREIRREDDVLDSTGPGLITTVYHDYKEKLRDIVLLRNQENVCRVCGTISCNFGNYALHYHAGSWRWGVNESRKSPDAKSLKRGVSEKEHEGICVHIDSEISKINIPDNIYLLRTYDEKPDDGLSYVLNRSSRIGVLIDDSKNLKGKKVIVSGTPAYFTDRLSDKNTNIVYTTFESTEIPRFWVRGINKYYDYCIVPHAHTKNVFEDSGVNIPLKVIHQGFTRHKRIFREMKIGNVFRIGFLGIPYERKNLFKLYQACVNLYGEIPELRLAVHVTRAYKGMFTPQIMLVKYSPFVEWTEGSFTEDEISKWYGRLSCHVFPSSGEGWSFTPRESMYLGIPTVVSGIPVHRDLTASGFCKEIPVSGKEQAVFEGVVFGQWDRVLVEDIENSIRDLYLNYGSCYVKALEGSRWIENKWTNESMQQRLLEFIKSI